MLRLLLIRAGIEQNPGPQIWLCKLCNKKLATTSVQCTSCLNWLHVKCSGLKSSKERLKIKKWTGPCCPPSVPGPDPPLPQQQHGFTDNEFKVLQYNINGVNSKTEELLNLMEVDKILVAAIQETKLTSKSKPKSTPNYTFIRKDRIGKQGGGLAFLVHNSIIFQLEKTPQALTDDKHIESLTITIPCKGNNLKIRNVYIPPVGSCEENYSPAIDHLFDDLNDTSMILGDFNAHHPAWFSEANEDARGRLINDAINNNNFGILNEDSPTRVMNLTKTSPDISIVSSGLLPSSDWKVEKKLGSDHLPIVVSLAADVRKQKAENRTFINFEKANWEKFTDMTEKEFTKATPVTNVYSSEKFFRKTILKAAKNSIPCGRIPKIYNAIPTETAALIDERDRLREEDINNNSNHNSNRIQELNQDINKKIRQHKLDKWKQHLEKCDKGSKKLWKTIKNLNCPQKQPTNQGISFNGKTYNDPKVIANKLNQQYTPGNPSKPVQETRRIGRNLKKKTSDPDIIFTPAETREAIRKSKNSKALGPDGISPVMLKNLGPKGIEFLTNIYNFSVNNSMIPSIWKTGRIIPLLKPGKPPEEGTSLRPVSLLCPPAKTLEALLLPYINEAIPLADHQHGFRKGRSTITALHTISEHITTGLNVKKPVNRTVSVAIDLSKAFDTVDHGQLLKDIYELQLNEHIKRFLNAYLNGRQTYVEFRGSRSKFRQMNQGVPQGGVLSPVLFNLYMSKMPLPPSNIKLVTYADDSNILGSGTKIDPICSDINAYLNTLDEWFKSRNLFISPSKSTATVFTTATNEVNEELPIQIGDEPVPTVKKPKFLGITFDNLHNFRQHTSDLRNKLNTKNNVLKALTGTDWGKEKETILSTYKAIGQSLINYGCPIWTPAISNSAWDQLQVAQNTALRTALGCHLMTKEDHLHEESKIMPVRDHCEMLAKQYLLATQVRNHPSPVNLSSPPPPRLMKRTLKTKFGKEIKNMTKGRKIDSVKYKADLKKIHTSSVKKTIKNRKVNQVLNAKPPEVNESEKTLPKRARSTLAQLRSSYSCKLNSYLSRIDPNIEDKCPDCGGSPHTTQHLFSCPAKPTSLTVKSLWTEPVEAARFLDLTENLPSDDNG